MTQAEIAERIEALEGRHCHKCELPKPACACADATAYDRWWEKYGRRAQEAHNG